MYKHKQVERSWQKDVYFLYLIFSNAIACENNVRHCCIVVMLLYAFHLVPIILDKSRIILEKAALRVNSAYCMCEIKELQTP